MIYDEIIEFFFYLISYLIIGFGIMAIVYFVIIKDWQALFAGLMVVLVFNLIFR